jgi:DNA gyrase subunit B
VKKGKEVVYLYSDEEKISYLGKDAALAEEVESDEAEAPAEEEEEVETVGKEKKQKIIVQRYKGLGEMNAEELWETTMNPQARILKQVTVEDAREADRIFDILMGTDVPSRKSFIQSNAKKATVDV